MRGVPATGGVVVKFMTYRIDTEPSLRLIVTAILDAYIEEHAVGPPYLGWHGHYGPLGHRLMAAAITPLLKNKLIDCRR